MHAASGLFSCSMKIFAVASRQLTPFIVDLSARFIRMWFHYSSFWARVAGGESQPRKKHLAYTYLLLPFSWEAIFVIYVAYEIPHQNTLRFFPPSFNCRGAFSLLEILLSTFRSFSSFFFLFPIFCHFAVFFPASFPFQLWYLVIVEIVWTSSCLDFFFFFFFLFLFLFFFFPTELSLPCSHLAPNTQNP